ncbi:tRNA (adenosine(37)-N6)-threonylcarbamoyltransferase complex dimerization subunit type 1 TsaB [Romeria aff. gracilis LEGE 07310]|uniref:tRNA (Adenosine(37)-N6)-threonylcarbamoyltransferase complex dimerization subunit type 1 TsaB n=1 Tax=Vasconcelosia minhoensis LEGE 07310 TaxID=915328 RepID=A0A8J7AWZ5_9CYAN|nr:tRNA (adenosine(37)-N6)-threonylcarbamoyltransferase complex dimerization subunit type 1 TsaB [Romeria gracilis]MBE9078903.1 tRNA (adenosine(37)-N6)-threonylcarbamoyltransferase complex dimerization subunit type 1 TsaB [Romeria aff. gracilis LEGE 07310]
MLGLALHTASPDLGLALKSFEDQTSAVSREQVWGLGRDLSTQMQLKLMEFIQPYRWTDLAFLAVAQGPGGFTGTRLGVVTARTLAQQLQIPLYGISTLAAVALARSAAGPGDIAVQMPARRGDLFGAIYRRTALGDLETVIADTIYPAADWLAKLAAWDRPLQTIETVTGEGLGDTAMALLDQAYSQWQQGQRPAWSAVLPFYGQHPVTD